MIKEKSRYLFFILSLILFSVELAKSEEVFVLDNESQLQSIERKHMQFQEAGILKLGMGLIVWRPNSDSKSLN